MKILFMGTPDFAVVSLEALLQSEHEICGVVTVPDKPKGRGYVMTPSPVKACATEHGLPVYTPATLKDNAILPLLDELKPDVIVVIAYGKILPPYVLQYPKYGCINVHGSLLPKYRGAAPINYALINGEEKTGITTMKMDDGIDTGDMLLKAETPITADDNFGTLHDRLAVIGADLLLETLEKIDTIVPEKQTGESTYASMIHTETCKLDFTRPTAELHNLIRGLSPVPGAFAYCGDKLVKILEAEPFPGAVSGPCGTIQDGKRLIVKTGDGALLLKTVQPQGKKPMTGESLKAGLRTAEFH